MASTNVSACDYQMLTISNGWFQDWNCTFTTCQEIAQKCGENFTTVDESAKLPRLNQSVPVYCFFNPDFNNASECARKLHPNAGVSGSSARRYQPKSTSNNDNGGLTDKNVSKSQVLSLLALSALGFRLLL